MDSTWRKEWAREWIELGEREGLTYGEVARRAGVCSKTVQRWSARLRAEGGRGRFRLDEERSGRGQRQHELSQGLEDSSLRDDAFVQLSEDAGPGEGRIEVFLAGGRRLVAHESVDVGALARVIAALDQC